MRSGYIGNLLLYGLDCHRDLREGVGVIVVFEDEGDQVVRCHRESIAENTRLAILNLRANSNFKFTNITHKVRNSC